MEPQPEHESGSMFLQALDTAVPLNAHALPTPITANESSTTTKIPVKRSGKKDVIAELTEATKADQAQSRHEGDLRHDEMMAELSNRKTRDDQRHTEKMLDKQIELRKL
jgi:hypothetical protein